MKAATYIFYIFLGFTLETILSEIILKQLLDLSLVRIMQLSSGLSLHNTL